MDLNMFQLCFIVASVVGIVLALWAAQPQRGHMQQLAQTRERQREFVAQCQADPGYPAKEKSSRDMAKFRHDSAHSMVLGRSNPARQRIAA